jgi:hypothetical protein
VLNADQIIFMDQGRVIGTGRHPELLESCLGYRKLYDLQFQGHGQDEYIPEVNLLGAAATAVTHA